MQILQVCNFQLTVYWADFVLYEFTSSEQLWHYQNFYVRAPCCLRLFIYITQAELFEPLAANYMSFPCGEWNQYSETIASSSLLYSY